MTVRQLWFMTVCTKPVQNAISRQKSVSIKKKFLFFTSEALTL